MKQISHAATNTPPPALVRAILRILRPLVKILLTHGVTYPYLSNLLKSVYIDVALHDFQLPDKAQTDSRLSLLTGVHRKDVKRLARGVIEENISPPTVSLGAALIARWSADPDYLDSTGQPLALPRFAAEGGNTSFEALVTGLNKDIRPRPILDEWLKLGIVHLDPTNRVCLNSAAFIPTHGFDELAFYFGQNVHDHLAAIAHNLAKGEPPFLERSVYYDHLTAESVTKLTELSRTLGMQTLQAINRQALKFERADQGKMAANQRMNFGIYFYSEAATDAPPNKDANNE